MKEPRNFKALLSQFQLLIVLFAMAGKVDWGMGIALAGGNLLGGLIGTHLTVLKGHAWVSLDTRVLPDDLATHVDGVPTAEIASLKARR